MEKSLRHGRWFLAYGNTIYCQKLADKLKYLSGVVAWRTSPPIPYFLRKVVIAQPEKRWANDGYHY